MDTKNDFDVWADFNDIDERGQLLTLVRFATGKLFAGQRVTAGDIEGNRCDASVVDIDSDGSVTLSMDLGSFRAIGCNDHDSIPA
jgi:hypothetical protein